MLNVVTLIGRLTADPEVRTTPNGAKVTSCCLAVQRDYVKQGEERQTDFVDCVAWNQTADFIGKFFKRGSQIAVVGRLQTRNYEDRDGNKRKATEVVISSVNFCDRKDERRDEPEVVIDDEDLPFD